MEQFYQPPKQHHRIDIHDIFPAIASNPEGVCFVPFNHERDKLGRIISQENKLRDYPMRYSSSCQLTARSVIRRHDLTAREKNTDDRVQKVFKVHCIPQMHTARDKQLRMTVSQSKQSTIPAVGQYDFAKIADKVKYHRAKEAEIKAKPSIPTFTFSQSKKIRSTSKIKCLKIQQQQQLPLLYPNKLELNEKLPELQKFHTMQKLQMKISANFERDHERFKSMVRQSLLLSNKIRRQLELD